MRSWNQMYQYLLKYPTGTEFEITKGEVGSIPQWVHVTILGEPQGELRQYRDSKKHNSLHIREFKTHYTAHIDKYNPEKDGVSHLIYDAPVWGAIFLVAGIAVFKHFSSRG